MTEFTPISGLIGGSIIGVSAVVLLLFKGRVAGISGILNGVFTKNKQELSWRLLFLSGIVLGPLLASLFGSHLPDNIELSWTSMLIGAFLVGFGTNLAGGCTSGHGICGVGRFSMRSIWATAVFMFIAILTVYATGYVSGGVS